MHRQAAPPAEHRLRAGSSDRRSVFGSNPLRHGFLRVTKFGMVDLPCIHENSEQYILLCFALQAQLFRHFGIFSNLIFLATLILTDARTKNDALTFFHIHSH